MATRAIRIGSVVTCKIGNFGEKGHKKSVPVKIKDIKELAHGEREYWFQILGLCVIGKAHRATDPRARTDLFCAIKNHVGYAGQLPHAKGIENTTDALAHLGYSW